MDNKDLCSVGSAPDEVVVESENLVMQDLLHPAGAEEAAVNPSSFPVA